MGFFDSLVKGAKDFLDLDDDELKEERKRERDEEDVQKKLDVLRNPMRSFMKKGDIGKNEFDFLKTTAAKLGIDSKEFEVRFDMVLSAKKEYDSGQKKGIFSSKSPDMFFYSEDEIEDYFESKENSFNEDKIEREEVEELRRPHFDKAFDEAFLSIIMDQAIQKSPSEQQTPMTPPPMSSQAQYSLNVNGQNYGPYNMQQLQQMVQSGQLTRQTYVWKQGMASWEMAGNVQELASLFGSVPPPPPMPPMPPTV